MFGLSRWFWLVAFLFAGAAAASGVVLSLRPGPALPANPAVVIQNRAPTVGPVRIEATRKAAPELKGLPPLPSPTAEMTPDPTPEAADYDPRADALDEAQARADGLGVPNQTEQVAASTSAAPPAGEVPVLMYHYIRVNPVATDRAGFNLSVTPADFAAQMRYLAEHGYHPVTMAQIREYVLHGAALPSHPVALTFDDGYDDAYTAARPILEQYHFTATFFIVSGFVDRPRYLTWSQISALDQSGFEIGSHTVHHVGLPFVSPATRRLELTESRSTLESHLGHAILDFCYPSGEVDAPTERAVRDAAYLSATTTAPGWAGRASDPLRIPRVRVSGGATLAQFAALLGQPPRLVAVTVPRRSTSSVAATPPRRPTPTATARVHR